MTSDPLSRFLTQRAAQMERRQRLRPMSVPEISALAIQVYQTLGGKILRLTAVPTLFCLAAFAFVGKVVLPMLGETSNPTSTSVQIGEAMFGIGLAILVGVPLFLLGVSYITGAVTSLVADYMTGQVPTAENARAEALRIFPKLFILKLREVLVGASALIVSLGFLMLSALLDSSSPDGWGAGGVAALGMIGIFAGFVVLAAVHASHALAPCVLQIEGLSPREAAKRSRALVKASKVRFQAGFDAGGTSALTNTYALIFVVWLVLAAGVGSFIGVLEAADLLRFLSGPTWFQGLLLAALQLLPWYLLLWVTVPIWSTTAAIVYFERRVRLEGYDIEALAKDVWQKDRQARFQL